MLKQHLGAFSYVWVAVPPARPTTSLHHVGTICPLCSLLVTAHSPILLVSFLKCLSSAAFHLIWVPSTPSARISLIFTLFLHIFSLFFLAALLVTLNGQCCLLSTVLLRYSYGPHPVSFFSSSLRHTPRFPTSWGHDLAHAPESGLFSKMKEIKVGR